MGGQGPVIAFPPETFGAGEQLQTDTSCPFMDLIPIGIRAWKPPGFPTAAFLSLFFAPYTWYTLPAFSSQLPHNLAIK